MASSLSVVDMSGALNTRNTSDISLTVRPVTCTAHYHEPMLLLTRFSPADDVQKDALYCVSCKIGGQTVELDFDTGSSDLWVRFAPRGYSLRC